MYLYKRFMRKNLSATVAQLKSVMGITLATASVILLAGAFIAVGTTGVLGQDMPSIYDPSQYSATLQGQEFPSSVGVYVWAEVQAVNAGAVSFNAKSEIAWHRAGTDYQITDLSLTTTASGAGEWVNGGNSATALQWLPITTDQVICYHTITVNPNVSNYRFNVNAPAGYDVYFYDPDTGYYFQSAVYQATTDEQSLLFIVKPSGEAGAIAGKVQDISPGETNMRMALGFLPNGQSAGYLDFSPQVKGGPRDANGGFFLFYQYAIPTINGIQQRLELSGRTAGPFYCNSTSGLVRLVCDDVVVAGGLINKRIRQIVAPQVLVDIERINNGASQIVRFYDHPADFSFNADGSFNRPSGDGFVKYEISSGSTSPGKWSSNVIRLEGGWSSSASISSSQIKQDLVVQGNTYVSYKCPDGYSMYYGGDSQKPWLNWCMTDQCWYGLQYEGWAYYYKYIREPSWDVAVKGNPYWYVTPEVWEYSVWYGTNYANLNARSRCGSYVSVVYSEGAPYYYPVSGVLTSRGVTTVVGFSGQRTETAVSYNTRFSGATQFNGDSFSNRSTAASQVLMGRWGAPRFQQEAGGLNPYTTPEYTSSLETVISLSTAATDLNALYPNFETGSVTGTTGYVARRKYADVFTLGFDSLNPRYPGRLFAEELPDRSWSMYGYYTDFDRVGYPRIIARPYLDTAIPASPPLKTAAGYRVQTIDYVADWSGAKRLPSTVESWVNGIQTAVSSNVYTALPAVNGQPVWQTVSTQYATDSAINAIVSTIKTYQGTNVDPLLRNQPYSIQAADGAKQCFAYHRGTVSGAGVFTPSTTGAAMRITRVTGGTSAGSSLTLGEAGHEKTIDAITFVPGVSTKSVIVRNERGLTVLAEQWIFVGGTNWSLLESQSMTYDMAGNLTRRVNSNGGIYEAEYTDVNGSTSVAASVVFTNLGTATGRLQYEKDETGVVTRYVYHNAAGFYRLADTIKLAVPAGGNNPQGIPQLCTHFEYDADGRVVSKTIGETGSEQISSSYQYDHSGRMTQKIEQGLTTGYTYNLTAGQITSVTETLPDGGTLIVTTNRDGSLKSRTGIAVVAQHLSYAMDGSRETVTFRDGSTSSARWVKTWTDGLGRTVKQHSATPTSASPTPLEIVYTYNAKGQLEKTQASGLAPTIFVYDTLGRLSEQGLALTDGVTLGIADRRSKVVSDIRHRNGDTAWWAYSANYAYPDGDSAGVVVSQTWDRLTGFATVSAPASPLLSVPGVAIAEAYAKDASGNESRSLVFLDRTAVNATSVTKNPTASNPEVTRIVGGIPVKSVSSSGVATEYGFDALHRVTEVIDRTRTATYSGPNLSYITNTTRIRESIDNAGVLAARYTYDSAGRIRQEEYPLIDYTAPGTPDTYSAASTTKTCYNYNARGQLTHAWGDTTYPTKFEYDATFGDRTKQRTYRSFPEWTATWPTTPGADPEFWPADTASDLTTLAYYPENGLLQTSTDAKNKVTSYVYNVRGQLKSRSDARKLPGTSTAVKTTYAYFEAAGQATGELKQISYNDGTTPVDFTYNRLGQIKTVNDATGWRTFTYRSSDLLPDQEKLGYNGATPVSGLYGTDLSFLQVYGPMNGATVAALGTDLKQAANTVYHYQLALDSQTGRLQSITTSTGTYTLGYKPNSDLLNSVVSSAGGWSQSSEFEANRDVLTSLTTTVGAQTTASYAYHSDPLGRRYQVDQSGALFTPYVGAGESLILQYAYNRRSEVTGANTRVGLPSGVASAPFLPSRSQGFSYDTIGNRTKEQININGATTDLTYTPDELNRYASRATASTLPVSGTVATGTSVSVNGSALSGADWKNSYFSRSVPKGPVGKQALQITGSKSGTSYAETVFAWARPTAETFGYDDDGNLIYDSLWNYAYDAESRLIGVYSKYPDETQHGLAVLFTYDYLGRRVAKRVCNYDASVVGATRSRRLYLYEGMNLVAEYETPVGTAPTASQLVRTYFWGPDLGGGAGGLLALQDHRTVYSGVYQPTFDGNGNLTALINAATGAIDAAYEYDGFGNTLRANGRYARENPLRFSTKYWDAEIGLYYYGFRYYAPSLGRFLTRDPIGEAGGLNLYAMAGNNTVDRIDVFGLSSPYDASFSLGGDYDYSALDSYFNSTSSSNSGFSFSFSFGGSGFGGFSGPSGGYAAIGLPQSVAPPATTIASGANAQTFSAQIGTPGNASFSSNGPDNESSISAYRDPGAGWGLEGGKAFLRGFGSTLKGFGSIIVHPIDAYRSFRTTREPLTPYGSSIDNFIISTKMKLQSPYGRGSLMGDAAVIHCLSLAGPTVSAFRGGLLAENTGIKTFFSVQREADAARLASGGTPWPTGLQRANLGEGLYTWGTRAEAEAYAAGKANAQILEFRMSSADYSRLKSLDMRLLGDESATSWLMKHSQYGEGLPHGFEHIIRQTGAGAEYYFSPNAFRFFK